MTLGLLDIIAPYFFAGGRPGAGTSDGIDLGGIYDDVIGALSVSEVDSCWDEEAVCFWGRASFTDPTKAQHTSAEGEWFSWHDIDIRFRLTVPLAESKTLASAVQAGSDLAALLTALGGSGTPSLAPASAFRLDLLITAVTLHLPFARPAQLTPDGLLVPDPGKAGVKLTLPKILVTLSQGDTVGSVTAKLDSWGATGLDTEADLHEGTGVTQDPPYALAGKTDSLFGWGFRSAVVDFSDSHTPPEILAIAGTGDDWRGVFFPEVRIFVAPAGIRGLAVDAGAKNLLIGVGPGGGVSGDFDIEVVNQTGAVYPKLRFQSLDGKPYSPHWTAVDKDGVHQGELSVTPSGTLIVDVSGGQPPYTVTIDGSVAKTRTRMYASITEGQVIKVKVTDSGPTTPPERGSWSAQLTMHPSATDTPSALAPPAAAGSAGVAVLTPDAQPPLAVRVTDDPGNSQVTLTVSPKPASGQAVTVTLDNGAPLTVRSDGTASLGLDSTDTAPHQVVVTWAGQPVPDSRTVYFVRDAPQLTNGSYGAAAGWADRAAMSASAVPEGQQYVSDPVSADTLRAWAASFPANPVTTFTVTGFASHEPGIYDPGRNIPLAARRVQLVRAVLDHPDDAGINPSYVTANGGANYAAKDDPPDQLPSLRKADIKASPPVQDGSLTYQGTLQRQAAPPPAHVETPKESQVPPPDWFRSIGLTVRLVRNIPVACELKGVVRFADLAKKQLASAASSDPNHQLQGDPNTLTSGLDHHGLVSYDLVVEWDAANGDFRVDLTIAGGDPADAATDWILKSKPLTTAGNPPAPTPDSFQDFAGLLIALMPAMAIGAGPGTPVRGVESLDVGFGAAVAITVLNLVHTKNLVLWGFEILTERHGDDWQAAVLMDIEADLWFKVALGSLDLLTVSPDPGMKVRYNAVGIRFGERGGQVLFGPAFDPSRGYELSAPDASAIKLPGPLGEILHLLAIRMASINPLQLEADIGMKADLGVVSVDRARVRLTLPERSGDQFAVTITALAASVNIPGVLKGSGSLALGTDNSVTPPASGFDGSLDLALTSLGLRIAATLAVRHESASGRKLTAVYASLEVDFPAPLPLLDSGLGIFGFIGLFGMHYARTEDPPTSADDNPALDWLKKAAPTAEINKLTGPPPSNAQLWKPQPDHWAFGLGLVLGTMEGGTILNLQGVLIVELPGPRLVIFVKAKFLEPKPATNAQVSGTITALVEIDPDQILIGLMVQYDNLAPLLRLRVPAGALFSLVDVRDSHIDIGTYHAPATARVLDLFDATAFVEIHGKSIDDVDPLNQQLGVLPGLAIAAGINAAIVWGVKAAGLYYEYAVDAVVGVSFSPFQFLGMFTVQGMLHLWVVSIEASATLDIGALATGGTTNFWLSGDVCGEVHFLFFTVKGCVHQELGTPSPLADAPPLVAGLTLQARTASPVHGTATAGRPAGASLTTASADPANPTATATAPGTVPVDAILVLSMATAPVLGSGFSTVGDPPQPAPLAQGTGWARRGQAEYQYTLNSVSVTPTGGTALTASGVQSVFRTGNKTSGDDTNVQYALLDWSPDPADQVMLAGPANDNRVQGAWGWVCTPVASAARVLWTFQACPPGPNPDGWLVTGTAFGDPPGTRRSRPAPTRMTVREPWRTGVSSIDSMLGIDPAFIDQLQIADPVTGLLTVRALAAPYEREPVLPAGPIGEAAGQIRQDTDASLGLLDAVTLSAGAATHVRMLLTVSVEAVRLGQLVVRPLDGNGQPLGADIPVPVTGAAAVPPEWTAPGFPAATDVHLAVRYATASAAARHLMALADLPLPSGTVTLLVGLAGVPLAQHMVLADPSFTLCVVELALTAEDDRVTQDEQDANNAAQTVNTASGSDPASRPLLVPGTTYTVTVTYDWSGRRVGDTTGSAPATVTQAFSFSTDATAPDSLEPWLLCTFPATGEKFHFAGEAPVICFAADYMDQLAAAYAKTLHAHVVPARGDLTRTSQPLGALHPVKGSVLSPFEHTLLRLNGAGQLPCLNASPGPRHGQAVIAAPLDPNCDYTLDLSYDAAPSPPTAGALEHALLRRGFSTGAYATATDLAAAIATAQLVHRVVKQAAATLGALPATPPDAALDTALASIGLGAVEPPKETRLVLLWEAGPPAAPAALLIDAPEPAWRTRRVPVEYQDQATGTTWWELGDQDWLTVAQGPASAGAAPVPVTGVIRNAAGTRVVCLLGKATGTGNPELCVTLNRAVDPAGLLDPPGTTATQDTLVRIQVGQAPWEEAS